MTTLSKVSSKYGAPMGRASDGPLSGRVRLARVRLDRGGYDPGGAYWGAGEPLWRAEDAEGREQFLRAAGRDAAKAKVPGCTFYR
jgi:hypothetical protein